MKIQLNDITSSGDIFPIALTESEAHSVIGGWSSWNTNKGYVPAIGPVPSRSSTHYDSYTLSPSQGSYEHLLGGSRW